MRSSEEVKLNSDTNYIPSRWQVVEATVGGALGTSFAWIKRISYGVDTENHLKEILNEYYYGQTEFTNLFPDKQRSEVQRDALKISLDGPLNEYQTVALSAISTYNRPNFKGKAPLDIG